MVLLVYTHYFGLLLVPAFVAANWIYGKRRAAFTAAGLIAGLSFLPWALYVLPVYESRGLDTNLWWIHLLLRNPLHGLATIALYHLGEIPFLGSPKIQAAAAVLVHLLFAAVSWRAIRWLWQRPDQAGNAAPWLGISLLITGIPVVLLFVFSVVVTPALHYRFLMGILPSYWLLMVLLAESGGRASRVALYGLIVPWVFLSTGISVADRLRPSSIRQGTLALDRQIRQSDLILCYSECNSVYWEWARRLGRPERIVGLRQAWTDPGMPAALQAALEQEYRLGAVPRVDLAQVDFRDPVRVWLFNSDQKMDAIVNEHLSARGFQREKVAGAQPAMLSLFIKGRQVQ
jgi:hypothetical protein